MYGTIPGGDTYFLTRLNSDDWDDADDDDKTAALTEATEVINQLNFIGEKTDSAQTDQFPRGEDTVVPDEITTAAYDISLILLGGFDPEIETENMWLKSRRYAQAQSTYDTSNPPAYILAGIPSARAWRKLVPYLRDVSALSINRVT